MLKVVLIVLAVPLVGCSGLHVSWALSASYNTDASLTTKAVHATSPVPAASAAK